jgi:hypothetical protein
VREEEIVVVAVNTKRIRVCNIPYFCQVSIGRVALKSWVTGQDGVVIITVIKLLAEEDAACDRA